jgi:hypothetical protein
MILGQALEKQLEQKRFSAVQTGAVMRASVEK